METLSAAALLLAMVFSVGVEEDSRNYQVEVDQYYLVNGCATESCTLVHVDMPDGTHVDVTPGALKFLAKYKKDGAFNDDDSLCQSGEPQPATERPWIAPHGHWRR